VRHFLACCSDDAIGYETTVTINIFEEIFTCKGLMIKSKNYLEIYIYENWNAKTIPYFEKGQRFIPFELKINNGFTQPPPLLSESELITCMDKNGIGTDATISAVK
jgi:DNA topoisomerase III